MNTVKQITQAEDINWKQLASELGEKLSENAGNNDANKLFVSENYTLLRENRFFKIAIPQELGGSGACFEEVCDVIREIGQHCGSTALSY